MLPVYLCTLHPNAVLHTILGGYNIIQRPWKIKMIIWKEIIYILFFLFWLCCYMLRHARHVCTVVVVDASPRHITRRMVPSGTSCLLSNI